MAKRSVVVHIAGQRYVVKSDADEAYVQSLAGFLNDRIEEVQSGSKPVSPHSLVALAALNIADELFREKKHQKDLKRKIRDKSKAMMTLLNREVSKHFPN